MIGLVTELSIVNICEEVYAWGYNTSGNYWWIGTISGYHEIDMRGKE